MKRIAFSGASGTGKTTLSTLFSDRYGFPVCPVGSRSVAASMGYSNPYDVDKDGRREEFQELLFVEKHEWEHERHSFITDRTYLDNVAYSLLHVDPRKVNADFLSRAGSSMRDSYDIVFFCPMSSFQDLAKDPSRLMVYNYHKTFEILLLGLHHAFGTRLVTIEAPGLEDRISYVESFL